MCTFSWVSKLPVQNRNFLTTTVYVISLWLCLIWVISLSLSALFMLFHCDYPSFQVISLWLCLSQGILLLLSGLFMLFLCDYLVYSGYFTVTICLIQVISLWLSYDRLRVLGNHDRLLGKLELFLCLDTSGNHGSAVWLEACLSTQWSWIQITIKAGIFIFESSRSALP